jgi:hypothetical protein
MKLISCDEISAQDNTSRYCQDFVQAGENFIHNLRTRLLLLDTGKIRFPCSVNHGNEKPPSAINSYVVSPICAYTDYCLVEIKRLNKPLMTWPLVMLVMLVRGWLNAAKIDRLVQINNWLLSTNIYPVDIADLDVKIIRDQLIKSHPDFALVFRSLNQRTNKTLMDKLIEQNFLTVPSRQVYFFDARQGEASAFQQRHNIKMDFRFLQKMPFELVEGKDFSEDDFARAEKLYSNLYIEKYCQHNPQYTAVWLMSGQKSGWLRLKGLRNKEGVLEGVVGWVENEDILTAPIVGYNTTLDSRLGLYRLLTQLCFQEAIKRKKLLNFSSGAASFKRLRGGEPEIEYSLVYIAHLNFFRRASWKTLAFLSNEIAVPLMKKWKL